MRKLPSLALLLTLTTGVARGEPRITVGLPAAASLARSTVSLPTPTAIGPVTNAWGVTYDPATRRLFTADPTNGRIVALNATTGAIIATVFTDATAVIHGLAADPPDRLLWLLDSATDRIRRLSLDTYVEGPSIALPGTGLKRPTDLAIDFTRNELFVADSAQNTVVRMSFKGTLLGTWSHQGTIDAWGVAVSPATGLVYASSYQNGTIYSWNPLTNTSALVAAGLAGPRGLTFDRFSRLLCLAAGTGKVMLVGTTSTATPFVSYPNGRSLRCDDTTDEDADLLPDSWELTYGSLNSWSANSDTDHDGNTAFAEAAFNGRPNGTDGAFLLPTAAPAGNPLTIKFPVRITDGISYRIWVSTDLKTWWVPGVSITDGPVTGSYRTRSATLNRAANGIAATSPVFFRVETFKAADF